MVYPHSSAGPPLDFSFMKITNVECKFLSCLTRLWVELKREQERKTGAKRKPIKEDEEEDDGKQKDVENGEKHEVEVKEESEVAKVH